jgi:hypothetical protein
MIWIWLPALACTLTGAVQAREPADLGGLAIPSLSTPGCQAIAYQPVAVYDQPAGHPIGHLVLDHPEWARDGAGECDARPMIELAVQGQPAAPVVTREVAYEHAVPAIFETRVHQGAAWYQVRSATGQLAWLNATAHPDWAYQSLASDLVQGLAQLPERCTAQGRCEPTPPELQALVQRAGAARPGCYGNAYDIVGPVITLPGGRQAYRVSLAPELVAAWGKRLPLQALVPTYDRQQQWTGFFVARGC